MTESYCHPLCDFCDFYDFNAGQGGVYVDKGMCKHPAHPGRRDPFEVCDDFKCDVCCKGNDG